MSNQSVPRGCPMVAGGKRGGFELPSSCFFFNLFKSICSILFRATPRLCVAFFSSLLLPLPLSSALDLFLQFFLPFLPFMVYTVL
jgi:hypothetical protein